MSTSSTPPPKPIDEVRFEGESKAFLPYPPIGGDLQHVPIHIRPDVYYYRARMGFFPNAIKLYLHVPWIAEHMFRMNNALMRDERNGLSEEFKYKMALLASRTNECPYCVSHHACTLERRWEYDEKDLAATLDPNSPKDEREAVAMEFVRQASADSAGVTPELRERLAKHFTPSEVMEIVLLVGFWKMYNVMHVAMDVPIEQIVSDYKNWATFDAPPAKKV